MTRFGRPRLESAVEESFEEARGGQWHSEEGATAEEGVEDQSATDEYASAAEEEEDDEDDPRRGHLEILAQRLDAMRRAGQLSATPARACCCWCC